MNAPVSRCVALCDHPAGNQHRSPSRILKRGVDPVWPVVGEETTRHDEVGIRGRTRKNLPRCNQ